MLLYLWGCKSERPGVVCPVARVGRVSISREALQARYGLGGADTTALGSAADTARWQEAARLWASEEILVQEARHRGLDQDSAFAAQIDNLKRGILIDMLYRQVTASLQVETLEVAREYEAHPEQYVSSNDQVDLLYILAPSRKLANQARRALQNDSSLSAILNLDDQLKGEAVGWVSFADLKPSLAKPVFALVPGGISYPLKYDGGGYIVLQCRQRRQAGTILPFAEVFDEIRGRILLRKKLNAEKKLRDSLWTAYSPEIFIGKEN